MASILLIGKFSVVEPLGLMFLAGALKEEGHKVKVFLFKEQDGSDIVRNACEGWHDFIGFSVFTGIHKVVFRKADILRDNYHIIIGGPHATAFMKECKEHADYVVPGEGMVTLRNICDGHIKPGIIFTPYLVPADHLPMPYREPIYQDYPELKDNPIKSVIVSLGCPWKCPYCFNSSYQKLYSQFKVRQRPAEHVIGECISLKTHPLKMIYFQDDCFGLDIEWLNEFSLSYKKYVGVPFHCQLRPEAVNQDRLYLLEKAGCSGVTMAIETANDDVRVNLLGRKNTIEQIRYAADLIHGFDMKLRTEQMLGLPNTTIDDELDLLRLNIEMNPEIAWTAIFAPYLGTELGNWCKANGWYEGNNDDLSDNFFSNTKLNFTKERARRTNMLHKIFATCAKLPDGDKLAAKFIEEKELTFDTWFSDVRQHLYDNSLYKV